MNTNKIRDLRKLAADLRGTEVETADGRVPKSISELQRMAKDASPEETDDVYGVLVDECVRASRPDLELKYRRQLVDRQPDDVLAACSLAECLSREGDLQAARDCVHAAVGNAESQNKYVRYALTTKLRLALARGDYKDINDALRALILDAGSAREEDYVFESDFLSAIDQSKVDQALLERYVDLLKADEN
jgi:hypothetical protein